MKKRLVGAAVIISLLVILLPLAFRGPVEQTTEGVPLIRFQPPFEEIVIPGEEIFEPVDAVDSVDSIDSSTEEVAYTDILPEPPIPEPVSVSTSIPPVTPPAPVTSTAPAAKVTPAAKPKTVASKAQLVPNKEGWVVQVGSFESLAKAESVQAFFKSKQIDTIIMKFKLGTKVYHRVRVMPPEKKSKAAALAKQISETYKNIDTLVFPYDS